MIEVKARLRKWGRSFGVVVPMDKIKRENFSENEEVRVLIKKKENPLKKHFGTFKFKRSIKEILD
jgi:antitoxin component of MazEF toxin-antitoxin module